MPQTPAPAADAEPDATRVALFSVSAVFGTICLLEHAWVALFAGKPGDSPIDKIYAVTLTAYAGYRQHQKMTSVQPPAPQKGHFFFWAWMILAFDILVLQHLPYYPTPVWPQGFMTTFGFVVAVFSGTRVLDWRRKSRAERDGAAQPQPGGPEGGAGEPDEGAPANGYSLDAAILAALAAGPPEGLTRRELQEKTQARKETLLDALKRLVAQGKVIVVSKGPHDPETRYKLAPR